MSSEFRLKANRSDGINFGGVSITRDGNCIFSLSSLKQVLTGVINIIEEQLF